MSLLILGIESSCDETAAALYRDGLVAERIASQIDTHARYGGIVPEIASREHLQALPLLVDGLFQESGQEWTDVDAIAVTAGPGLMGALLVGVAYAKAAGIAQRIPVVPVHHMEGHLLAPGIAGEMPAFPFITLLVSGGHTLLVLVQGIGRYRVIGQTLDDAAGECFDKTARLLGLAYPGGPEIARLAVGGDARRFRLPRPMLNKDNLDFSFSGLKTAVMYAVRGEGEMDGQARKDMAAAIEEAMVEVLVKKSIRACLQYDAPRLVVAGGVAANHRLRAMLDEMAEAEDIGVFLPEPRYCTDNAAMIAHAAYLRLQCGWQPPEDWDARPRCALGAF